MIHTLRLRMSNVHLVVQSQIVLFDTGSPGEEAKILRWIKRLGLGAPSAINLTHGHADHAGSAAALRQLTGAPICLARADWPTAAAGRNRPLHSARRSAVALKYLAPARFAAFEPDVALDAETFADQSLDAEFLQTPGHTEGSISVLLPDGHAIVGDVLMGGYLGGLLLPQQPRGRYSAEAPSRIPDSLARVLAQGARTLHVGHGGPLSAISIETWSAA